MSSWLGTKFQDYPALVAGFFHSRANTAISATLRCAA
jgi:hypothetical protein